MSIYDVWMLSGYLALGIFVTSIVCVIIIDILDMLGIEVF